MNVSTPEVERNVRLGPNVHGPGDAEEMVEMERIALEDESVKRELQQYGFPEGTVAVCDPWIYGMAQSLPPRRGLSGTSVLRPDKAPTAWTTIGGSISVSSTSAIP